MKEWNRIKIKIAILNVNVLSVVIELIIRFILVFHTNKLGLFTYAHLFYRKTHNIDPWPTIQSLPGKTRNPKPGT